MIAFIFFVVALFGFHSFAVEGSAPIPPLADCGSNSTQCGPVTCCPSGFDCNYRRGIPICTMPGVHYISGFDLYPCADPYLFRCDVQLGIPGFCCPIGSECITLGDTKAVQCISSLGTTVSAFPSATTGPVVLATPISSSDPDVIYSPSEAWNTSTSNSDCTSSKSLHATNSLNATISFNYTGPSIMVHTVSSWNGGVFSVIVDGVNTTEEIDTYAGYDGSEALPTCYPVQFPPFGLTPPNYQTTENHTISLVYIGPSPLAPAGNESFVQFDSFALPDLESIPGQSSSHGHTPLGKLNAIASYAAIITLVYMTV